MSASQAAGGWGDITPAWRHVPNALTLIRVLLSPAVVALLLTSTGPAWTAAAVFALAALTDVLDGHLARTQGTVSTFGKLADPIADKLIVGSALVALVSLDRLAAWVVLVVVAREVAVSVLRDVARRRGMIVSASRLGKAKATLQMMTILALMVAADAGAGWLRALTYAMVAVTVASGLDYFMNLRRRADAPVPVIARARGAARPSS